MRVLQPGDQLSIGRSILVYGSPGEIDGREEAATPQAESQGRETREPTAGHRTVAGEGGRPPGEESSEIGDEVQELFPKGPPEVPADLKMAQVAQLSDMLAYIHDQLALVVDMAVEDRHGNVSQMRVDREHWQRLLKLEMQLASYLRQIADPHR
jgi:hypothetical protein